MAGGKTKVDPQLAEQASNALEADLRASYVSNDEGAQGDTRREGDR